MDQNAVGVQNVFHAAKTGAEIRCGPGMGYYEPMKACVPLEELKKLGKCPWGTGPVKTKDGKIECRPENLPLGQACPVVDMQRPTWLDPASKIMIADVPRWQGGGLLANKEFINALKIQGAMEALQALALPGGTPYAALAKDVGQAHAVVSHLGPDGQQGHQQYGVMAYNSHVPGTLAVSTAPTAAVRFARSGF